MGLARWFRWLRGAKATLAPVEPAGIGCLGEPPADLRQQLQRIAENTPVGGWRRDVPVEAEALLARAVEPHTLRADGRYTVPRSFGVYEIPRPAAGVARFHFGNHPVRQRELAREHGDGMLVALYQERDDAEHLCRVLNG